MIILEGPDDSGKTTFGKMICEAFGYTLIHSPGILKNEETFIERKFWYNEIMKMKNVVLDRCFYLSEYVYGPIIRKTTWVDFPMVKEYIRRVIQQFGIIIFFDQKFESKGKNESLHLSDSEREVVEDQVANKNSEIRKRYKEMFNEFKYHSGVMQINKIADYALVLSLIRNY